jgi:hypothetical protein
MLDLGGWMLDLEAGCWTLEAGCWTWRLEAKPGGWKLDRALIIDPIRHRGWT